MAEVIAQVTAIDYGIKHTMPEQKFGSLKTFGKLLTNRLLDHAGSGKADERSRLGDI